MIVLAGAVVCYSMQSFGHFNFMGQVSGISVDYRLTVLLAVLSTIVKRFDNGDPPADTPDISRERGIPLSLADASVNRLVERQLIESVVVNEQKEIF
ncbi:MAG: hypothetical protein K2F62_05710, partial [Muribaculaceae bacterium]|nr:hypothetical protein [Muribaculaceae bacterium]